MKSHSLAHVLPVMESPPAYRAEPPRKDLHLVANNEPSFHGALEEAVCVAEEEDRWQTGYEAGLAAARSEALEQVREAEKRMAAAILAARAQWVAEEGVRLAEGLQKALAFVEGEICAGAERVLSRVVEQGLRARALSEFAAAVRLLLRDGQAGMVTIHAPADLVAVLEKRIGEHASIDFIVHDAAEVWVRSGQTMIETRLSAWQADIGIGA